MYFSIEDLELANARKNVKINNLYISFKLLLEGQTLKFKNGKILAMGLNQE